MKLLSKILKSIRRKNHNNTTVARTRALSTIEWFSNGYR